MVAKEEREPRLKELAQLIQGPLKEADFRYQGILAAGNASGAAISMSFIGAYVGVGKPPFPANIFWTLVIFVLGLFAVAVARWAYYATIVTASKMIESFPADPEQLESAATRYRHWERGAHVVAMTCLLVGSFWGLWQVFTFTDQYHAIFVNPTGMSAR